MILFIDNYDSFTYNLVDLIGQIEADLKVIRNDDMTIEEIRTLSPEGIVISPGPGTPDDAGISCDVIEQLGKEIPLLGVCLGHQSIGQVFGAKVVRSVYPVHGKASPIKHNKKGLFKGLSEMFDAARYHSLIIDKNTVPASLEITAETEDGIIMALKHRDYPIYGVQFHPESILTVEGKKLLNNWIEITKR
jgi:anthranilate synthase/aminodeoxychorismate synthase-like glutamine amidotransferase